MAKKLQNIVATGRLTLPVTVGYACIMLLVSGMTSSSNILQICALGLSTFLMVVLNNGNSLIRVFSRLVSCSFLAFSLMCPILIESLSGSIVQVLLIAVLLLLFQAYQDRRATGTVFYAFVCLGLTSTQFIQILFFVPLIWLMIFTSLQEGSLKVLVASTLGLLTPYWFWLAYALSTDTPEAIQAHLYSIAEFEPLCHGLATPSLLIPLIFIIVIGGIGAVHFFSCSYADNIKTRMFYNVFIVLFAASILFLVLQPQHYQYLMRLAIISASPLVAHYFTFTSSRTTNIIFIVSLVITFVITILNTWIF